MVREGEIYEGKKYKFRLGTKIGSGGNGEVYEVKVLNDSTLGDCVVKFLYKDRWKGIKREIRYARFLKEIETVLELQEDIEGIMKILDYYCPHEIQDNKNVWYLMHKAESFRSFSRKNKLKIREKLSYLIDLSDILYKLHSKEYSHRDIKVDNLLIIDGKLLLSDFGLVWNIYDNKITMDGERLGPINIGPPELESRDSRINDFRAADVYLFSKVTWEVLTDDFWGFRGSYIRSNSQFYLDPLKYGISTFEPIHQLMEQATKIKLQERIPIESCKEFLKEQLLIINNEDKDKEQQFRFSELQKEVLNEYIPNEVIYSDFEVIYNILKKFLPISNVVIDIINENLNVDSVVKWSEYGSIILENSKFSNINSYLCYPKHIAYINNDDEIKLHIKEVEVMSMHEDFIQYKDSKRIWGAVNNNIFLNESLVIKLKKFKNT